MNKNKSKIKITIIADSTDNVGMSSRVHLRNISRGSFAKGMLLVLKDNIEKANKQYGYENNFEKLLIDVDVIDIENMKKAIKEAEEQEELLNEVLGELKPKKRGRKPSEKGIEINE